jgi:hypothetical protein
MKTIQWRNFLVGFVGLQACMLARFLPNDTAGFLVAAVGGFLAGLAFLGVFNVD